MAENPSQTAELNLPGPPEKADDFREVYVNHIRLSMTPADLVIYFGHITETKTGNAVIKEDVGTRLSPQTMKLLVGNLAQAMAVWESQFGVIPVTTKSPQEVLAAFKEAGQQKS
jgi:hypothetical protein